MPGFREIFSKQQRGKWEDKTYHVCLKSKQNTVAQMHSPTDRMKRRKAMPDNLKPFIEGRVGIWSTRSPLRDIGWGAHLTASPLLIPWFLTHGSWSPTGNHFSWPLAHAWFPFITRETWQEPSSRRALLMTFWQPTAKNLHLNTHIAWHLKHIGKQ